jgi:hypothetical protein
MAERVQTGGTKSFHYEKDYNPKLNPEQKSEIKEAYAKADERKRKQRTKRNIIITVIILILLLLLFAFIL